MTIRRLLLTCVLLIPAAASADDLDDLARDFWQWRAATMPDSLDDIPRLERPADWDPDWSAAAIARRQSELAAFTTRWRRIDVSHAPLPRQVDKKLMGSALARAHWEANVMRGWQRNPFFYVDQTLGSLFLELLPPPPFPAARSRAVIHRLQSFARILAEGRKNLTQPAAPFGQMALNELKDVRPRLLTVARELKPLLEPSAAAQLDDAAEKAIVAAESYRQWVASALPQMSASTAVGRDKFEFFLKNVALLPYSPEQLIAMSRQEWDRAAAFEAYETQRNREVPPLPMFATAEAQMAREAQDELAVRAFLDKNAILSMPADLRHYRNRLLPAYVAPLASMGVTDDLTSPSRLDQDATSYIRPPAADLGYFGLSTAKDPRPIIVHEGVPGHYFQKVMSWRNPDPIRRHYYDSSANEGIGFYAEEMLLQAGLWDDSPHSREVIYNFMRLRALRVEVAVRLATGEWTIDQGTRFLQTKVPMDEATAHEDAAFYASTPGVGISYQIGKLQILNLLAEARQRHGKDFRLREFHDFLWRNGNVPIALVRWEYLGMADQVGSLATF